MRRANTLFQLMTILEENHHSFLIVEHDSLLYEDSQEMVGRLGQDPHMQKMAGVLILFIPSSIRASRSTSQSARRS